MNPNNNPNQQSQHIVVWHDPNINSPENSAAINFLKQFVTVKTFTDYNEASNCLKQESPEATLYAITAGRNGEQFTQAISDIPNLHLIYVFCGNVIFHKTWASKYPKVGLVEDNSKRLVQALEADIKKQKELGNEKIPNGPSILPCFEEHEKEKSTKISSDFQAILEFQDKAQAIQDFLVTMQKLYPQVKIGNNLEEAYKEHKGQFWSREESEFGQTIRRCLRSMDTRSLNRVRIGLKEIQAAIVEQYHKKSSSFTGRLYALMKVTEEEWARIKQGVNKGKDIVIPDFLRVSKEEGVWNEIEKKENSEEWVCVSIIVEEGAALLEGGQGLADLRDLAGNNNVRDEVIFGAFSKFKVQRHCTEEIEEKDYKGLILKYNPAADGVEKQNNKVRHQEGQPVGEKPAEKPAEKAGKRPEQPKEAEGKRQEQPKEEGKEEELKVSLKINASSGPKQLKCRRCNSAVFVTPGAKQGDSDILCDSCMQMSERHEAQAQAKKDAEKSALLDSDVIVVEEKSQEKRPEKAGRPVEEAKEEAPRKSESQSAIKKEEEKVGESPVNISKSKVSKTLKNADIYLKAKEYELAESMYEEYLKKNESGPADRKVKAYSGIGTSWSARKADEKALEYYLKALEVAKGSFGQKHTVTREVYGQLASVCNKLAGV